MSDECDPIIEAGDDGEVLAEIDVPPGAQVDRSADGSITSIVTPEGDWRLSVDTDTEFGEQLAWIAGHRGQSPEELLRETIEEFADKQRESDGR
jgi:hypothetical protein